MASMMLITESRHVIEVSRSVDPLEEEPDQREVIDWLTTALIRLDCGPSEVSVRIVDEDEMAGLNAEFRDRPEPTNVLSFPSGLELGDQLFLGDIVVCSSVVRNEAQGFNKSLSDRYAHIVIHGLLHLLGHDHEADEERTRMESLEATILEELGVSDPYEVVE